MRRAYFLRKQGNVTNLQMTQLLRDMLKKHLGELEKCRRKIKIEKWTDMDQLT